jgi:hypothetical protein
VTSPATPSGSGTSPAFAGDVARSAGEGSCLCGRCGTPFFFESSRWPGELHVRLGSVEPGIAARLATQAHAHWADRVPWIGEIHDGLPRHDTVGSS